MLWFVVCCKGNDSVNTVEITDAADIAWERHFRQLRGDSSGHGEEILSTSRNASMSIQVPDLNIVRTQPIFKPINMMSADLSSSTDCTHRKRSAEDASSEARTCESCEPAPEPCTEKFTSTAEDLSVFETRDDLEDLLIAWEAKRRTSRPRPTLQSGSSKPFINTWQATISKVEDSGRLGLEIAAKDNTLRVESVGPDGPMVDWNSANADKRVEVGDFVISVNGHSGPATLMLEEAQRASSLRLTITRAMTFFLTVNKSGSLGVTLGVFTKSLVVKEITRGPIQSWNEENLLYSVQPGDLVLEVNGIRDNSLEMLGALKLDGVLRMQIQPLGGAGY